MYDELIYQGADPGANAGGVFTGSINEQKLAVKAKYLHELTIGLGGTTATAAVTSATALDLLNPFVLKAGQQTRFQLRGRDLLALNLFYYGSIPHMFEANSTSDLFVYRGLRLPVHETIDPNTNYAWSATRAAQTNVSVETLELAARWNDAPLFPKPISAVEQPFTTAGATGRTNLNLILPKVGKLIGLIVFNNVAFSNTTATAGVQRLQLYRNGKRSSQYNWGTMGFLPGVAFQNQELLIDSVLANYGFIDLRESPLDAIAEDINVEVDVESTSASARLIPVFELA